LDSAVALYLARSQGYRCSCLIFDYGQRHRREVAGAKRIAQKAGCRYQLIKIVLPWKGSSLLGGTLKLPERYNTITQKRNNHIPSTYVPARNIIFLSFALSCAEAIGAEAIFIGAHTGDYSGYPDCRPEFYRAFAKVTLVGTKSGVEKKKIKIKTPLIKMKKAEIIRLGLRLAVPLEQTWSCYTGGEIPCGKCDSCYYRAKGFSEAKVSDPLQTAAVRLTSGRKK
jgi:7-cyano-7-deazaguanine synthase